MPKRYDEAIRLEPSSYHYSIRARAMATIGRLEEALEDFDKALGKEVEVSCMTFLSDK